MLYVVAFLCPPLAVLLTGRIFTAIVVLFLSLAYFPGALVALLVVSGHNADRRNKALIRTMDKHHKASMKAEKTSAMAMERQAKSTEDLVKLQKQQARSATAPALLPGSTPTPHVAAPTPSPSALPVPDDASPAALPGPSLRERAEVVAAEAKRAYDSLPEWGQPVVWGLAAASPVSAAMLIIMALRG